MRENKTENKHRFCSVNDVVKMVFEQERTACSRLHFFKTTAKLKCAKMLVRRMHVMCTFATCSFHEKHALIRSYRPGINNENYFL